jgi:hypothetical protein
MLPVLALGLVVTAAVTAYTSIKTLQDVGAVAAQDVPELVALETCAHLGNIATRNIAISSVCALFIDAPFYAGVYIIAPWVALGQLFIMSSLMLFALYNRRQVANGIVMNFSTAI